MYHSYEGVDIYVGEEVRVMESVVVFVVIVILDRCIICLGRKSDD
jgi:hypothetical protein